MNTKKLFVTPGFLLAAFLLVSACSMYESPGRKAIESNEGGIVGTFGLSESLTEFYVCGRETTEPDFLKSPLEVVETPFDAQNITTLYNSQSSPPSVIVYTVTANSTYAFCRVSSLLPTSKNLTTFQIQKIAESAAKKIENITNEARP